MIIFSFDVLVTLVILLVRMPENRRVKLLQPLETLCCE